MPITTRTKCLFDLFNFYYCRFALFYSLVLQVYLTYLISTIVDTRTYYAGYSSLFDLFNFYYCRWWFLFPCRSSVYLTYLISTIVDLLPFCVCVYNVYLTCLISTIVDMVFFDLFKNCLFDLFNFYYCRWGLRQGGLLYRLFDLFDFIAVW